MRDVTSERSATLTNVCRQVGTYSVATLVHDDSRSQKADILEIA